jgi:hypothetical protein
MTIEYTNNNTNNLDPPHKTLERMHARNHTAAEDTGYRRHILEIPGI